MGNCLSSEPRTSDLKPSSHSQLAKATNFNIDEVYALEQLYKQVSNSLHQDGVIQKDEFMQALFSTLPGQLNLFADRVGAREYHVLLSAGAQLFVLFDLKENNVVDFDEFVRALSVFHPKAPFEEKAEFAFRIYDLDRTGDIQPGEVARLLMALLQNNPDIALDDSTIQQIVSQTFEEADLAKDGRISQEEWLILVHKHPVIINFMTLPLLREVTTKYPSFIWAKDC